SLSSQLALNAEPSSYAWSGATRAKTQSPQAAAERSGSVQRFTNGQRHGMTEDGKGYRIHLGPREATPAPWSNVIANPNFGFLVTERGGGYTWSQNSRENRLTPWSNDPVCDPCGEALYIRDLDSGEYWSPTPAPVGR